MDTRYRLLQDLADGVMHSGEQLAERHGISRAAVWKHLQALRDTHDLELEAVPGKGYRLLQGIELLDPPRILGALPPASVDLLHRLDLCGRIPSTNTWLMGRGRQGAPKGSGCIAEQQTEGRGRHGRNWVSPYGANIYLSLLWRFDLSPVELSGLSLAAGLAVLRALQGAGVPGIGLKWPNDVLWQGRKLAGLLLEVVGESGGPSQVVLGVGVNLRLAPRQGAEIDQPWIDLDRLPGCPPVSRNELAGRLLGELLLMLRRFEQDGLRPWLEDWLQNDLFFGKPVILRSVDKEIVGVHRGIDSAGAILLEGGGRIQAYHAGEMSLRGEP